MTMLHTRHRAGHDILLARHGNTICSMRLDRGNNRVIALLDDGSVDSAPNLIAPGLRLPETIGGVLRADWKFLTVVSGGITAVSCVLAAGVFALAGAAGRLSVAELTAAFPAF